MLLMFTVCRLFSKYVFDDIKIKSKKKQHLSKEHFRVVSRYKRFFQLKNRYLAFNFRTLVFRFSKKWMFRDIFFFKQLRILKFKLFYYKLALMLKQLIKFLYLCNEKMFKHNLVNKFINFSNRLDLVCLRVHFFKTLLETRINIVRGSVSVNGFVITYWNYYLKKHDFVAIISSHKKDFVAHSFKHQLFKFSWRSPVILRYINIYLHMLNQLRYFCGEFCLLFKYYFFFNFLDLHFFFRMFLICGSVYQKYMLIFKCLLIIIPSTFIFCVYFLRRFMKKKIRVRFAYLNKLKRKYGFQILQLRKLMYSVYKRRVSKFKRERAYARMRFIFRLRKYDMEVWRNVVSGWRKYAYARRISRFNFFEKDKYFESLLYKRFHDIRLRIFNYLNRIPVLVLFFFLSSQFFRFRHERKIYFANLVRTVFFFFFYFKFYYNLFFKYTGNLFRFIFRFIWMNGLFIFLKYNKVLNYFSNLLKFRKGIKLHIFKFFKFLHNSRIKFNKIDDNIRLLKLRIYRVIFKISFFGHKYKPLARRIRAVFKKLKRLIDYKHPLKKSFGFVQYGKNVLEKWRLLWQRKIARITGIFYNKLRVLICAIFYYYLYMFRLVHSIKLYIRKGHSVKFYRYRLHSLRLDRLQSLHRLRSYRLIFFRNRIKRFLRIKGFLRIRGYVIRLLLRVFNNSVSWIFIKKEICMLFFRIHKNITNYHFFMHILLFTNFKYFNFNSLFFYKYCRNYFFFSKNKFKLFSHLVVLRRIQPFRAKLVSARIRVQGRLLLGRSLSGRLLSGRPSFVRSSSRHRLSPFQDFGAFVEEYHRFLARKRLFVKTAAYKSYRARLRQRKRKRQIYRLRVLRNAFRHSFSRRTFKVYIQFGRHNINWGFVHKIVFFNLFLYFNCIDFDVIDLTYFNIAFVKYLFIFFAKIDLKLESLYKLHRFINCSRNISFFFLFFNIDNLFRFLYLFLMIRVYFSRRKFFTFKKILKVILNNFFLVDQCPFILFRIRLILLSMNFFFIFLEAILVWRIRVYSLKFLLFILIFVLIYLLKLNGLKKRIFSRFSEYLRYVHKNNNTGLFHLIYNKFLVCNWYFLQNIFVLFKYSFCFIKLNFYFMYGYNLLLFRFIKFFKKFGNIWNISKNFNNFFFFVYLNCFNIYFHTRVNVRCYFNNFNIIIVPDTFIYSVMLFSRYMYDFVSIRIFFFCKYLNFINYVFNSCCFFNMFVYKKLHLLQIYKGRVLKKMLIQFIDVRFLKKTPPMILRFCFSSNFFIMANRYNEYPYSTKYALKDVFYNRYSRFSCTKQYLYNYLLRYKFRFIIRSTSVLGYKYFRKLKTNFFFSKSFVYYDVECSDARCSEFFFIYIGNYNSYIRGLQLRFNFFMTLILRFYIHPKSLSQK